MGFGGELRANTAVDVLIGPFVDSTDGDTEETGLTIAQASVLLSKNGQALTQKNDNTTCVHDADGYYNCELDTTDTNTEGQLVLEVHVAGALAVRHDFDVLAEAAWDSKYVAKDDGFMDVNVKTVGRADTQETEANNLEAACAAYSATRGLSGTALPAAAADAAGGLPISDAGGLDIDAILADTNELQTDWVNGGRLDLILDIIAADTTTDIPATITTMQGNITTIMADTDLLDDVSGGLADIHTDVAAVKSDTAAILLDTGTDGVVVAAASKTGYALAAGPSTIAYITLAERIYQMLNNAMVVTDATGVVSLKAIGGASEIAVGAVNNAAGVTDRDELTWA